MDSGQSGINKEQIPMKDLELIVYMNFGSHLYGTDTPESDRDYMGVYMPTKKQILLGNFPGVLKYNSKEGNEVKNTADDEDTSIYSLHRFIEMACAGKTEALDMLHAPDNMLIEYTWSWETIRIVRDRFYCKNLQSMSTYVQKQAAKYGIKGSRINDGQQFIEFANKVQPKKTHADDPRHGCVHRRLTLADVWNRLPLGEHLKPIEAPVKTEYRFYSICDKVFQETAKLDYIQPIIQRYLDEFGHRAKKAAKNEGIDWKAVSHALRAAYQVKQILEEGTITYPLKQAGYIKVVKLGRSDFLTQVVPTLDELTKEIEELVKVSTYPETVDREFWNDMIFGIIMERFFNG